MISQFIHHHAHAHQILVKQSSVQEFSIIYGGSVNQYTHLSLYNVKVHTKQLEKLKWHHIPVKLKHVQRCNIHPLPRYGRLHRDKINITPETAIENNPFSVALPPHFKCILYEETSLSFIIPPDKIHSSFYWGAWTRSI